MTDAEWLSQNLWQLHAPSWEAKIRNVLAENEKLTTTDEEEGGRPMTIETSTERAAYARRILVHYFREAIGERFDSDGEAEVNAAIDDLLDAARGEKDD